MTHVYLAGQCRRLRDGFSHSERSTDAMRSGKGGRAQLDSGRLQGLGIVDAIMRRQGDPDLLIEPVGRAQQKCCAVRLTYPDSHVSESRQRVGDAPDVPERLPSSQRLAIVGNGPHHIALIAVEVTEVV